MKYATVKSSTLATTGTWEARHNIAVVEWLKAAGLPETTEHVRNVSELIKRKVTAVRVDAGSGAALFSVGWNADGARFHIWLDEDHKMTSQTVYKNAPLGVEYKGPGYFPTRRLDAMKHTGLIEILLRYAEAAGLFYAALDAEQKRQDERLAEIEAERRLRAIHAAGPVLLNAAQTALRIILQGQKDGATFEDYAEAVDALRGAIKAAGVEEVP